MHDDWCRHRDLWRFCNCRHRCSHLCLRSRRLLCDRDDFYLQRHSCIDVSTLGRLLSLSPHSFGLSAGTAINDLSSVEAAALIFGHGSTSYAVVKLTRTLMIVPISIAFSLWRARLDRPDKQSSKSCLQGRQYSSRNAIVYWLVPPCGRRQHARHCPKSWHTTF